MTDSVLIAGRGTQHVDREFLRQLPEPVGTMTHQPIPHIQIVEALIETLGFRHINVLADEYAVSPDGARMFGLMELDYEFSGCRFAIGIRNANDKSMRLALTVGYRVFVCENMAFHGDFEPVLAKHSKHFSLQNALSIGVDQMQRNFHSGLLWQANYMWSHVITDASSGAGEQTAFEIADCRACDRSNAPYDIPQNFTTSMVYQLPFGAGKAHLRSTGAAGKLVGGWELSAIASARSGLPINILVTRKANQMPDGNASNQRPNLVSGAPLIPPAGQNIAHWLNPAAFAMPAPFTWGNLGRFAGRGPGEWEAALGVSKRTPIAERVTLNFRAEAFNLFNHPNFANPIANISSGAFGRIISILNTGPTGTGGVRKIEFMMRLEF